MNPFFSGSQSNRGCWAGNSNIQPPNSRETSSSRRQDRQRQESLGIERWSLSRAWELELGTSNHASHITHFALRRRGPSTLNSQLSTSQSGIVLVITLILLSVITFM